MAAAQAAAAATAAAAVAAAAAAGKAAAAAATAVLAQQGTHLGLGPSCSHPHAHMAALSHAPCSVPDHAALHQQQHPRLRAPRPPDGEVRAARRRTRPASVPARRGMAATSRSCGRCECLRAPQAHACARTSAIPQCKALLCDSASDRSARRCKGRLFSWDARTHGHPGVRGGRVWGWDGMHGSWAHHGPGGAAAGTTRGARPNSAQVG